MDELTNSLRYPATFQYRFSPIDRWTVGADYSDLGGYAESVYPGLWRRVVSMSPFD